MKTPFKKLRGLGLRRHHKPDLDDSQLDELSLASQDMQDMKDCYDSLLSTAAATANSAYEFSESIKEMGDCLLEKTSLNDDEDSGRVLLMLGKVQFEIQKLLDTYRSHISRTITVPSESLLNELRVVEDMKKQCDEKRKSYDEMRKKHKEKRRLGSGKGEYVSSHQLQAAREEFDEDAMLFVFRMNSLKRGQSRSLLTQAARHHAAQMCFFRKALKSLEAIEPHVKLVTEQQHIDYQFSGLEDDDRDSVFLTDDEDDEEESDDEHDVMHEDGELSFEYQRNHQKNEASSSGNSTELNSADLTFPQVASVSPVKENTNRKPLWNSSTFDINVNKGSKSAPLFAEGNMDPSERFRQMRQSSARKLNTYVLPTPLEKSSVSSKLDQPTGTTNMWHSSPLDRKKYEKIVKKDKFSGPIVSNSQSVLKESNNNSKPTPLPSPGIQIDPVSSKKIKRYAFSGPIAGSVQSNKSVLSASGPIRSGSPLRPPASTTSFVSSPKISELHELPRPPAHLVSKKQSKVGFSAPLVTLKGEPGLTSSVSTLPVQPEATAQSRSVATESQNLRTAEGMVSQQSP